MARCIHAAWAFSAGSVGSASACAATVMVCRWLLLPLECLPVPLLPALHGALVHVIQAAITASVVIITLIIALRQLLKVLCQQPLLFVSHGSGPLPTTCRQVGVQCTVLGAGLINGKGLILKHGCKAGVVKWCSSGCSRSLVAALLPTLIWAALGSTRLLLQLLRCEQPRCNSTIDLRIAGAVQDDGHGGGGMLTRSRRVWGERWMHGDGFCCGACDACGGCGGGGGQC